MKGREDIIKLLLLLFYNNNTYSINYTSMTLLSKELFTEETFMNELKELVFMTER